MRAGYIRTANQYIPPYHAILPMSTTGRRTFCTVSPTSGYNCCTPYLEKEDAVSLIPRVCRRGRPHRLVSPDNGQHTPGSLSLPKRSRKKRKPIHRSHQTLSTRNDTPGEVNETRACAEQHEWGGRGRAGEGAGFGSRFGSIMRGKSRCDGWRQRWRLLPCERRPWLMNCDSSVHSSLSSQTGMVCGRYHVIVVQ